MFIGPEFFLVRYDPTCTSEHGFCLHTSNVSAYTQVTLGSGQWKYLRKIYTVQHGFESQTIVKYIVKELFIFHS